ncbi:hypothetical protein FB45DRAFT_874829 [Roridomyces roridus]|uniref:Uncharacterized protein n=1 Tax=Roridomyces roridus TaxID=1738132 RepID=A0AAD7FAP6_9AGAR|nr:hypothetical protein FB45DRAFT_874829 [Roridomyces roridus]
MVANNPNALQQPRTVWVLPHNTGYANIFPLPLAGLDRMLIRTPAVGTISDAILLSTEYYKIHLSHLVPGRFDDKRLIAALRSTLDYYPSAAARLRIKGDDWWLDAGKRGIPVRFQTTEEPLNHQPDLSVIPTEIIDPLAIALDVSGAVESDGAEPLVQIKVTYCSKTDESAIGLSYSHMLATGDAHSILQFLSVWSQYYQGKEPLSSRPTYEKYRIPQPPAEHNNNPETDAFLTRHAPHLRIFYPKHIFDTIRAATRSAAKLVDLFFSLEQIEQLRYVADSWVGQSGGSAKRTTESNALGAYFIATMNRCLDVPITRVVVTVTARGIKNPDYLKSDDWRAPGPLAAGNHFFQVYTPTLSKEEARSIGAVAAAMQQCVKDARQYDHVKRLFAISDPIMLRMVKENTFHSFLHEGIFRWNNIGRFDGDVLHFGFGTARSHSHECAPGSARCFQAPTKGRWSDNVEPHSGQIHQQFLAMVAADLNSTAFPNNIAEREQKAQEKILRAEKARL